MTVEKEDSNDERFVELIEIIDEDSKSQESSKLPLTEASCLLNPVRDSADQLESSGIVMEEVSNEGEGSKKQAHSHVWFYRCSKCTPTNLDFILG